MRQGADVHGAMTRRWTAAGRLVARVLGIRVTAGREAISEAELRDLIAVSTVLDGEERRLIQDVLASATRNVREVMVPRTDVTFLPASLPVEQAVSLVQGTGHSRFPVVDGSPDDILGFVHLRDLLLHPGQVSAGAPSAAGVAVDPLPFGRAELVGQLARDVKRLPASKRLLAALSEMRREGHHLAVVVDEYGGTAGIVTLEDLIEELVGEIHDEYDPAPEPAPDAGTVPSEVDGRLNLADFAERTGLILPTGPYETVAGYLMATLGRLPAVGDEVRVGGWRLVVNLLDGRRVARVALHPVPAAARPEPTQPAVTDVEPQAALVPNR